MKKALRPLIALALVAAANLAAAEPQTTNVDISNQHFPVAQLSSSETEVYISALLPRLPDWMFRATPVGQRGPVITGEIVGEPQLDPGGQLHEKVVRVKFSGLQPNTQYNLELGSKSNYGTNWALDFRTFKTLDNSKKPLKYIVASCFSDEPSYENARQKIWPAAIKENPDLIVMIGDQVYIDSVVYVERHKATAYDVWARNFRSFSVNPLFRSRDLIPLLVTWDDHDTGIDNGNMHTPTVAEARKSFYALYGASSIAGQVDASTDGTQQFFKYRGFNFILLDNRTWREDEPHVGRYAHLGQAQEEWLLNKFKTEDGPFLVFEGGMWGLPTVTSKNKDGSIKRVTEGFFSDHPTQYAAVMEAMNQSNKPYVLFSGDIHMSQVVEHGPQWGGTSRYAPFETVEITASPAHSIIFGAKPGEAAMWPDDQRVVGAKNYNFVVVESKTIPDGLDISARSVGLTPKEQAPSLTPQIQDYDVTTLFSFGKQILRQNAPALKRRQILADGFTVNDGKVKVAFFDADDTLRKAPSGKITATTPTDVALLPNVASKIAELTAQGYFIAIVSNQGGIAVGLSTLEISDQALQYTIDLIQKAEPKARVHYYDFADRGKGDIYSKPNVGMATQLERLLSSKGVKIDWVNSFMVGDAQYTKDQITHGVFGSDFSDSDRRFAENLGIATYHPRDFFKSNCASNLK